MAGGIPAPIPLQSCEVLPKTSRQYVAVTTELKRAFGLQRLFDETPAPNPVSMDATHVEAVTSSAYFVSPKTDGVRATLVLTLAPCRGGGGAMEPIAVLLDRALRAFVVPITARQWLFKGTVLDGELVCTSSGQWQYVVFDVVDAGARGLKTNARLSYGDRLQFVVSLLGAQAPQLGDSAADVSVVGQPAAQAGGGIVGEPSLAWDAPASAVSVSMVTKDVVPLAGLRELLARRAASDVPSDGLVLTPHSGAVGVGKVRNMFKLKDSDRDTLDVRAVVHMRGGAAAAPPAPSEWAVLYKHGAAEAPAAYGLVMGDHTYRMVLHPNWEGLPELRAWDTWSATVPTTWRDAAPPACAKPLDTARHVLLECTWELDSDTRRILLTPQRVRDDKPHANDISTIVATVQGRLHRLTVPDLLAQLEERGIVAPVAEGGGKECKGAAAAVSGAGACSCAHRDHTTRAGASREKRRRAGEQT